MFVERNLNVLTSETMLKSKGDKWFGNVTGVKSEVGVRIKAKEGIALLLKQLWNV